MYQRAKAVLLALQAAKSSGPLGYDWADAYSSCPEESIASQEDMNAMRFFNRGR